MRRGNRPFPSEVLRVAEVPAHLIALSARCDDVLLVVVRVVAVKVIHLDSSDPARCCPFQIKATQAVIVYAGHEHVGILTQEDGLPLKRTFAPVARVDPAHVRTKLPKENVTMHVDESAPRAQWMVRISELFVAGTRGLYGLLRLSQRLVLLAVNDKGRAVLLSSCRSSPRSARRRNPSAGPTSSDAQ